MLLITTHSQFHNLHSTKFIVVSSCFAQHQSCCVLSCYLYIVVQIVKLYTFFCKMSRPPKSKVFYCFFLFSYFFKVQTQNSKHTQNHKTQNTKHNQFRRVKKFFCPFLLISISCCAVCPRLPCCAFACPISCPNSFFFY